MLLEVVQAAVEVGILRAATLQVQLVVILITTGKSIMPATPFLSNILQTTHLAGTHGFDSEWTHSLPQLQTTSSNYLASDNESTSMKKI